MGREQQQFLLLCSLNIYVLAVLGYQYYLIYLSLTTIFYNLLTIKIKRLQTWLTNLSLNWARTRKYLRYGGILVLCGAFFASHHAKLLIGSISSARIVCNILRWNRRIAVRKYDISDDNVIAMNELSTTQTTAASANNSSSNSNDADYRRALVAEQFANANVEMASVVAVTSHHNSITTTAASPKKLSFANRIAQPPVSKPYREELLDDLPSRNQDRSSGVAMSVVSSSDASYHVHKPVAVEPSQISLKRSLDIIAGPSSRSHVQAKGLFPSLVTQPPPAKHARLDVEPLDLLKLTGPVPPVGHTRAVVKRSAVSH